MSEQNEVESTGTGSRRARVRRRIGQRAWVRSAALIGSGLVAGGILAGALTASAADEDRADTGSSTGREDRRGGAGEEALTGDTATQVEEAVLAEYPEAEIERLETDADGVYEAHLTTADGEELTVELDEEFAITGSEAGGHGPAGHGGTGGRHGGGRGGPGAGEEALTGDTATQVEEAVLAEYPEAEIERLETDADGVYEAHLTTADGEELTVELDEGFAITGTEGR